MNIDFPTRQSFLVAIDSDGCAFDTMEVKHKECFIPNIIRAFKLAAVSKYAREAAEFVNLYSKWRGINRFPALIMTMDLLRERPEVQKRGISIPRLPATRRWIESESKLANPALEAAARETNDPELAELLEWSKEVNRDVARIVHHVPPFPMVRESLARLAPRADILVASATPGEALAREWQEHDIARYCGAICGQEVGTKKQILGVVARYPSGQALMVGDAPGDLEAARANGALFFPILPGHEDESWQRFHDEAIDRFLAGTFTGPYEAARTAEFEQLLPSTPPWK